MPHPAPAVVLQQEYPDPIGQVWAALTESDRLAPWIGTHSGGGAPGGTVEFTMTGEVDAGGEVAEPVTVTVVECVPPRRLVVDFPETDERTWRVALTLAPQAGGTILRFEQPMPTGSTRRTSRPAGAGTWTASGPPCAAGPCRPGRTTCPRAEPPAAGRGTSPVGCRVARPGGAAVSSGWARRRARVGRGSAGMRRRPRPTCGRHADDRAR